MDLNDLSHCTHENQCAVCGSVEDLNVAVLEFAPIGVGCVTVCGVCIEVQRAPKLSDSGLVNAVWQHCDHLGITADEMAVLLKAERAQAR